MKLTGSSTRFRCQGAGAYFTEVTFEHLAQQLDLGGANDDRAKQFADPSTRAGRITARGLVERTSNLNFIDVCKPCRVVDVTDLTGVNSADIDFYAPWQVLRADFRSAKQAAAEDGMELIGTGGAIEMGFDPDAFMAEVMSSISGGGSGSGSGT